MVTVPVFAIRSVPRAANGRSYNPPPELAAVGTVAVDWTAITSPQGAVHLVGEYHRNAGAMLYFLVIDDTESPVCLCTIDPTQVASDVLAGLASVLGPRHPASIVAVEQGGTGGVLPQHIDRVHVLLEAATSVGVRLLDYIVVSGDGSFSSLAIEKDGLGLAGDGIDLRSDYIP